MQEIVYDIARTQKQLEQILALQKINLPKNISQTEKDKEGFVTVEHDLELLSRMNEACPHIIASVNNRVIGYALVMLEQFKDRIEILIPMFKKIDDILKEKNDHRSYFVMGQVCIDKPYRGMGVFKGLYDKMRDMLQHRFDCCITEVDPLNIRSLKAHHKQGFERLSLYADHNNRMWELIIWDWK